MSDLIVLFIVLFIIIIVLYQYPIIMIIVALSIISAAAIRIVQSRKKKQNELHQLMQKAQMEKQKEYEEQQKEIQRTNEQKEAAKKREEFLIQKRSAFKSTVDNLPLFEIKLSNEKHNRNPEINIIDKEYKNIIKSTPVNKIKDYIAVDVETTGLKTGGNDIIQLSAIKYRDFVAVEAFNTYVKPRKSIPKEASEINHITDDMVENAPHFYQIIDSFNAFIENLPLIAHNAPFDIKHLYVNGLDSVEEKTVYDTLSLCRRTYKDHYSYTLKDMCDYNYIYICDAHNSLYDSYAAGELFKCIVADRKEIDINNLFTTK